MFEITWFGLKISILRPSCTKLSIFKPETIFLQQVDLDLNLVAAASDSETVS